MTRQTSILELVPDEETESFVVYGVHRGLDGYRGEQHARCTSVLTPQYAAEAVRERMIPLEA